jgi:hypothetical protein
MFIVQPSSSDMDIEEEDMLPMEDMESASSSAAPMASCRRRKGTPEDIFGFAFRRAAVQAMQGSVL